MSIKQRMFAYKFNASLFIIWEDFRVAVTLLVPSTKRAWYVRTHCILLHSGANNTAIKKEPLNPLLSMISAFLVQFYASVYLTFQFS